MLSDICYEQIKDNFWFGSYGEFKVVMMKDCGWVNATKLCYDNGERLHKWLRLDSTKELINYLETENMHDDARQIRITVCKYIETSDLSDEGELINGIYIHPDLLPSLACWVKPVFALKVSKILQNYAIKELDASSKL